MRTQVQYRLLVVRLGSMGDILHALPAITALRKAHPAWKIDWAVEPQWLPLLSAELENANEGAARTAARPIIDQIHLVPAKEWGRKPWSAATLAGIRALRADLRAADYDAVLDLQGSIKSAVVSRLTGCKRIVGSAKPRELPAKWMFTEQVRTAGQHVIEQAMEMASAVAGDLLPAGPLALPLDLDSEEWCDQHQELKSAIWMGKPVVLIHPGGGWGAKRWPPERYGAVAQEFGMRGGVVLVNSGPDEDSLAEAVVESAGGGGQDKATAVKCSLPQLIALTRRVSLVIGGDTGPMHLACALGKPVVGIYGPTDPNRNGPYGSRFRVLRNPESRQDHARRAQTEAGLLTISPEMVISAVVDLMIEERKSKHGQGAGGVQSQQWDSRSGLEPSSGLEFDREMGQGPIWEAKRR